MDIFGIFSVEGEHQLLRGVLSIWWGGGGTGGSRSNSCCLRVLSRMGEYVGDSCCTRVLSTMGREARPTGQDVDTR